MLLKSEEIRENFGNGFKASIWFKDSNKYEVFNIENVGSHFLRTKSKEGYEMLLSIDDISIIVKMED